MQQENIEQRMFAAIGRWQRSGLTQKAWCKGNRVKYATFHYWYKRYRNKVADTAVTANRSGFVKVLVDSPAEGSIACELVLPDGKRLIFHHRVSVDFLKTLIA